MKPRTTKRAGIRLPNDGSFVRPMQVREWQCPCGHKFRSAETSLAPEGCPECHGLDAAPVSVRRAS